MWPFRRKLFERVDALVMITMKDGDVRVVQPWRRVGSASYGPWFVGKWGHYIDDIEGEDLWVLEPNGKVAGEYTDDKTTWRVL